MKPINRNKFLLILIFLVMMALAYVVLRPFLLTIISSAVVVFFLNPVYQKLLIKTKRPNISAGIVVVFIILLIIIPSFFLINIASREALISYTVLQQKVALLDSECDQQESKVCDLLGNFGDVPTQFYLQSALEKVSTFVITKASNFALSIPQLMINFFVMVFTAYYLFLDGPRVLEKIKETLPYKKQDKERIFRDIYQMTYGIIYGMFLLAIVEGLFAWIGFSAIGIPGPLLWSFLIFLLAFIPMLGPAIVWIPFALLYFLQNNVMTALMIVVIGVIISIFDTVLRPKILGKRAKVHPVIILLGILGGIAFFGFIGVIIGPIVLSMTIILLDMLVGHKHE